MEVLNDLLGYKNRKIYQNTDWFSFNLDSILLSNFITINKQDKKVLDIGTGTGVIPLVLSLKTDAKIDAVEIQNQVFLMCSKTMKLNNLEKQVNVINCDIKDYSNNINNYYDIIISNPPYFKNVKTNLNSKKAISRHEIFLDLDNLIRVSKKMLKNKGSLFLIYNSDRFVELITKLNENNLIPKRVRFIHLNILSNANTFLIECVKNGNNGLKIEKPFILYNKKNVETSEYSKILKGDDIDESEKL